MRSEEKSRAKHELFEILSLFSRALIDAFAVVRLMSARAYDDDDDAIKFRWKSILATRISRASLVRGRERRLKIELESSGRPARKRVIGRAEHWMKSSGKLRKGSFYDDWPRHVFFFHFPELLSNP